MRTLFVLLLASAAIAQTPTITKAPAGLVEGKITGAQFGKSRGKLYATVRFDASKTQKELEAAGLHSSSLAYYGGKPESGRIQVPDAVITSWADSSLSLKWTQATIASFEAAARHSNPSFGPINPDWPIESLQFSVELAPDAAKAVK